MKACNAATNNSITFMNKPNAIETGEIATVLNMKMIDINDRMIICPAVMFANKRIIKAKGLDIAPTNSIGAKRILIGTGTPGIHSMCFQ